MFSFRYLPCPDCGEAVERAGVGHRCRVDQFLDAEVAALRAGTQTVEAGFHDYLATPEGRFEAWLAAREVRRSG